MIDLPPVKVLENIFWVGVVDWNIRHFHGFTYSTQRGTTENFKVPEWWKTLEKERKNKKE